MGDHIIDFSSGKIYIKGVDDTEWTEMIKLDEPGNTFYCHSCPDSEIKIPLGSHSATFECETHLSLWNQIRLFGLRTILKFKIKQWRNKHGSSKKV